MKKAYVFPGQGSQFPGMGKDLYENNSLAIKISFAKILPNLIETIIYFNQKIKSNFQNLTFENRKIFQLKKLGIITVDHIITQIRLPLEY